MNNKGFAISTMLYGLIIIILLVMLMILSIMSFNRKNSKEFSATIRDQLEEAQVVSNTKFFQVFTYNETTNADNYCVTGNEATCKKSECYKNKVANSCKKGDIVKYRVNDNEMVTFHVLYDDANTITMQSQKNSLYNTPWISGLDYDDDNKIKYGVDKGPVTLLHSSSEAQSIEVISTSWSNVNDLSYTSGTATGCSAYNSCTSNACPNFVARTRVKARILTLSEAVSVGCTPTAKSCPKWMYNYLQTSTTSGGTANDDYHGPASEGNYGYWTLSVNTGGDGKSIWEINQDGSIKYNNANTYVNNGARAVVVVNKE